MLCKKLVVLIFFFSIKSLAMHDEKPHLNSLNIKASWYDVIQQKNMRYPEDVVQNSVPMNEFNENDSYLKLSDGMHKTYIVMRLITAMKDAIKEFHNKDTWASDKLNYQINKIKEEYEKHKDHINNNDASLFKENANKINKLMEKINKIKGTDYSTLMGFNGDVNSLKKKITKILELKFLREGDFIITLKEIEAWAKKTIEIELSNKSKKIEEKERQYKIGLEKYNETKITKEKEEEKYKNILSEKKEEFNSNKQKLDILLKEAAEYIIKGLPSGFVELHISSIKQQFDYLCNDSLEMCQKKYVEEITANDFKLVQQLQQEIETIEKEIVKILQELIIDLYELSNLNKLNNNTDSTKIVKKIEKKIRKNNEEICKYNRKSEFDPKSLRNFMDNQIFELEPLALKFEQICVNLVSEKSVEDLINLASKLHANILEMYKEEKLSTIQKNILRNLNQQKKSANSGSSSFDHHLVSGGGQSFTKIWEQIKNGKIPTDEDFIVGNLLKEFDLSIPGPHKKEGSISFGAGIAINLDIGKMWVQMTTSVAPSQQQLERHPFNLVFLVDISGSMNSNDFNGEYRYNAAIEFLKKFIETELQEGDCIEILLFDTSVKQLLNHTEINNKYYNNKKDIIEKLKEIKPSNHKTNLLTALEKGYKNALSSSRNLKDLKNLKNLKNALIVLSDCNDNENLNFNQMKLSVNTYAKLGIHVIFIGMGSGNNTDKGFNQNLVDSITQGKGCYYDFVKSKQDLLRVIPKIKSLLNPLFFDIEISLSEVNGASIKDTFGAVNYDNKINIKTLTLASGGMRGSPIIVEYDISTKLPSENNNYNSCTRSKTGEEMFDLNTEKNDYSNYYYTCSCDSKKVFCFHCIETCHHQHSSKERHTTDLQFYCDCYDTGKCSLYKKSKDNINTSNNNSNPSNHINNN